MSRKSNLFTTVPVSRVRRNLFDLSHEVKMSGKFGFLYPVLCIEGLPGDVIRDQMTAMCRFAPLLSPVMHRVDVKTDFFFVPNRLLTDAWEDFITGGQDGTLEPVLPYIEPQNFHITHGVERMQKGSLWDYLGLPVQEGSEPAVYSEQRLSFLPFRAYNKIWNDYFRDPNLDDEQDLDVEIEGDVSALLTTFQMMDLRIRGWESDYYTAALPFAQRGPSVLMPFDATVNYRDQSIFRSSATDAPLPATTVGEGFAGNVLGVQNPGPPAGGMMGPGAAVPSYLDNIESISAGNITINDLRRSLAIQRWLENNARGGARYTEQIFSHFNTRVPDYRLQRAEYLGGGRQPVQISEVLSTANTEDVPVGDMAGHGISVGKSNRFSYHCQEHGFVIGIMSVVPRTAYDQGIEKMWMRESKYDYAWPELAHLGEQEILSKEVFYSFDFDDTAANNAVFGYIPRYAEYKFKQDRVSGDFRDTLAFWHLSRIFVARPTLNSVFQQMRENNVSTEETSRRIFAVQDGTDYLWFQLYHRLTAKRPLPYFGVPTLMG